MKLMTKTPPTEPGYYWYQHDANSKLKIVEIEYVPILPSLPESKELQVRDGKGPDDINFIENYDGFWCQIEEPQKLEAPDPAQPELFDL